jgi:hypothetical protein
MTDTIFTNFVWIWIAFALILFPILLKVTAPYGRYTTKKWGPLINNRLGWFIMESPALIVFLFFIIGRGDFSNIKVLLAFILWGAHYFHRVVLFPLRINTEGKKMPVIIMLFAVFFNLINGFVNGYWLGALIDDDPYGSIAYAKIVLGVLLFITGFIINKYHDRILIRLRKISKNGYQIPYGGLFRYVSCPNFFGEIMEWGGFALMVWSLPALSFLIWTFVNLVPRAIDHHKWYKQNFTDYPPERKAVIPFVL